MYVSGLPPKRIFLKIQKTIGGVEIANAQITGF